MSLWRWLTGGLPGASIPFGRGYPPLQKPVMPHPTPPAPKFHRPENGETLIRLSDMTREQWSKYNWLGYGPYLDDPEPGNPVMMRSRLRTPDAAKKAWDEFETFEKLNSSSPPPE